MQKMEINGAPSIAPETDDIIWGVENIAKIIKRTQRQTFHMMNSGTLPGKKVGGRWVASRRKLLEAVLGDL